MIRVLGVGLLLGMAMGASAAVAQLPISPVYRSGSEQAQPAPDNGAPAKDRAPVTGDDRENAPPAKPSAGEPQPVATAPIPPPLRPDANDGDAAAETRSRPASSRSEPAPEEKTQKGQAPTATAATPPLPPAPVFQESVTEPLPSRATENAADRDPKAAPSSPRETKTGRSEAESRNGTKKAKIQSDRRQARTRRYAQRRGPVYYSWRYYARSFVASPDRTRGYGGGLYGPAPYSSEGP